MRHIRTAFALVGLDPHQESLYRRLLPFTGQLLQDCAAALELHPAELRAELEPMVRLGAVEVGSEGEDDTVRVHPPARLLSARVAAETEALRDSAARLDQLRDAMPALRDLLAVPTGAGEAADGELLEGTDVPRMLEFWIRNSAGDLLWMRPDQWALPSEPMMRAAVAEAAANGRRSRAIYPARALEEAPEALLGRMAVGEEVRIVAHVPSRMAIIGDSGVLLSEVWGHNNDRRLRVRQPALRAALTALFDEMWNRGIALGPAVHGRRGTIGGEGARRLLLEELARGSKDEQIARALGVSLRTIRRRVADLMLELGSDSRFQAGVEAVRRGLI